MLAASAAAAADSADADAIYKYVSLFIKMKFKGVLNKGRVAFTLRKLLKRKSRTHHACLFSLLSITPRSLFFASFFLFFLA